MPDDCGTCGAPLAAEAEDDAGFDEADPFDVEDDQCDAANAQRGSATAEANRAIRHARRNTRSPRLPQRAYPHLPVALVCSPLASLLVGRANRGNPSGSVVCCYSGNAD